MWKIQILREIYEKTFRISYPINKFHHFHFIRVYKNMISAGVCVCVCFLSSILFAYTLSVYFCVEILFFSNIFLLFFFHLKFIKCFSNRNSHLFTKWYWTPKHCLFHNRYLFSIPKIFPIPENCYGTLSESFNERKRKKYAKNQKRKGKTSEEFILNATHRKWQIKKLLEWQCQKKKAWKYEKLLFYHPIDTYSYGLSKWCLHHGAKKRLRPPLELFSVWPLRPKCTSSTSDTTNT